jgi:hypothetical protein
MTTIKDILSKFGDDTVSIIRDNMRNAGQNATGQTSAGITSETSDTRVTVSAPRYIWVLEKGRGPYAGGPASGLASKLEDWIRAKGVSLKPGQTIEQAGKSLAYIINKQGTKLYRQGGRKDIITPIFDKRRFDDLYREISNLAFDKTSKTIANANDNRETA